jgi:hypothetical protein
MNTAKKMITGPISSKDDKRGELFFSDIAELLSCNFHNHGPSGD